MSNPLYFCHSCNREVRSRDSDLKCSVCGGEFIEEIEQHPTIRFAGDSGGDGGPSGLGPNPMNLFGQLLTGAVGAGPSQRPAPARSARGGPTPTPAEGLGGPQNAGANGQPDPVQNFIQNLLGSLGGLAGPDVHLQINFSGPNGRGEGVQIFSRNLDDYAWGADGLDRIVTNLLNQFDANQPEQGLAPEELERVPVTKVTQKHVDNTTQCTTCMETFKLDESVLELGCRHIFHRDCLIPWLERHRTCPICRQEVDPSGWQANTAAPRPQDHIDQQPPAPSGRDPMNDFDLD